MSTLKRHSLSSAVFSTTLVLAIAQGCGDDNNANPKPPDVNTGGGGKSSTGGSSSKAGSAGKGGKDNSGAGTSSTDGGTGSEPVGGTGSEPIGGIGNDGGTGGTAPIPECDLPELGNDGCFNCPKQGELEQWLNRCSDGDCEPFDNKARLPKLNADGSVPDLPN